MTTEEHIQQYVEALQINKSGYTIILERDIDELYVNSFNPEWTEAWNGNTDLQICLDYFAVITYITEYFTKDDTGTMELLINAMKNSESETLIEKMKLMMNTFITHRQMGEVEAIYKIFPDFHFKDSNISCVFLPNCPRSERSKFLQRADGNPQYEHLVNKKLLAEKVNMSKNMIL